MTSDTLIDLLEQHADQALGELDAAYGAYCRSIARNILQNEEDAEECVSDAYLAVWNAIPPARPEHFKAWLGTIVRNGALRRKRQNSAAEALREELSEALPDRGSVAGQCEAKALGEASPPSSARSAQTSAPPFSAATGTPTAWRRYRCGWAGASARPRARCSGRGKS